MQIKWSTVKDFILGYLVNVVLVSVGLFSVIAGIVYLITTYAYGDYLPSVQWIGISVSILIASILLAQGIAYFRIARRLIPGERIEECLTRIAESREECVNQLFNYPVKIETEDDLNVWENKFLEWHRNLIPAIEKVSSSQASIFKVLGTFTLKVPKGGFNTLLEAKEARLKGIIEEYNNRLKEMVDRFSLENLSNRVTK